MSIYWHRHCFHATPRRSILVKDHNTFGSDYRPAEQCCKCDKRQEKRPEPCPIEPFA